VDLVRAWLTAFALTLAVEAPIVAVIYRRAEPRLGRRVGLVVFANLATHPAVWFVFTRLPWSYAGRSLGSEIWAFGLELVYYALVFPGAPTRAAVASITANAASLTAGYLWLRAFGHF